MVSQKQLIALFFNTIRNSPAIQNLFPQNFVRVYDTMAPPEPQFPYIVHRILLGSYSLEDTVTDGQYFVSAYTAGETTTVINNLVDKLIDLLTNQILSNSEVPFALLVVEGGGSFIETGNANVQRYDLPFDLRYAI